MNKLALLGSSAIRSAAALACTTALAGAAASPAFAQQTEQGRQTPPNVPIAQTTNSEVANKSGTKAQTNAQGAPSSEAIVVTGSRISRPNLQSTVPITSVGGEEFFQTAKVSIGDVLNELPQLRSTFSQSNSTSGLGTAGQSILDLRGLGTSRTLVLVNGRRHVGQSAIRSTGIASVDVGTIPSGLIERVDIVTGGNSAVYGSDAIAGVVNFILKQNFDGVQLRGQGGITKYGDGGSYFIDALAGKNFANGRGNVAVGAEYGRQQTIFADGRPYLQSQDGFLVVDANPPGLPNGSNGIPDRLFFQDIRSSSLNNTGLFRFGGTAAAVARGQNCGTDPLGSPYTCNFVFLPDGTLVPQTGLRVGVAPGSFIGGNGENFRGQGQFQLLPRLDRYNINLLSHFEISKALVPFVEAKYARTETLGTGSSGPAFIQGATIQGAFGGDSAREQIRLDNPFLSEQARALITQQLILQNGVAPTGATRIPLRENLLGLGIRNERARRETYRGVAGIRGSFLGDWRYELSGNYGKYTESTRVGGNLNTQRFLLANDPVRNAAGQIVCRSQVDPAAVKGLNSLVVRADPNRAATLATDVAACVPINPFGGQFTQAQRDYLLTDATSFGKITQFDVNGFISGNSGRFFSLPGGPVSFALGAEYRRDTSVFRVGPEVERGYTFYNAIKGRTPPAFQVKEAFGEIRVPLLKDIPLFDELTLSAAGRVSKYRNLTKAVYAYNYGVDYAPVRDLRFRANYSRAVRSPSLGELFNPASQNFRTVGDPCSKVNIGVGTSNRVANCAASGVPAGYDFRYTSSLLIQSAGNPLLEPETSDSWTFGGVLQPRFIPGLSFTVDYYNIRVNNVINAVGAQTILNQCVDLPSLNNPFCALFQRAGPQGGPNGEIAGRVIEGSLTESSLNFAKFRARGIDFELAYRRQVGGIGRVSGRVNWTHGLTRENFTSPTDPNFGNRILGTLGDPVDKVLVNMEVKSGPLTIGGKMRYIGKMVLNNYEDFFSYQGRPPQNADYADRIYYPALAYFDSRIGIDAGPRFNFYLGIDNITDKRPPLGLTGIGGGSGIYDVRGRTFYAGAVAKF